MKSKFWLACVLSCFLGTRGADEFLGFILNGEIARPREFPYMVGIGRFQETGYPLICGGGIIDEKFVLTDAHCVTREIADYDNDTFTSEFADDWVFVYANTTNFQKDLGQNMNESRSGLNRASTSATTRRVVKAYIPSEYLTNGIDDIAILELESPLNLNDGYHRKLKLPTGRKISYEGAHAVLAGFGADKVRNLGPNDLNNGTLKKAHFRIVPYSVCKSVDFPEFRRQNSMCLISVTEDNQHPERPLGACGGDSGGPLVQGNTIIGIITNISGGTCDGRDEYPQMCMKVSYYKNFINSVIANRHRHPGNKPSIAEFKFKV